MVLMLMHVYPSVLSCRRQIGVIPYGKTVGASNLDVAVFSVGKPVVRLDGKLSLVNRSPKRDMTRGQIP